MSLQIVDGLLSFIDSNPNAQQISAEDTKENAEEAPANANTSSNSNNTNVVFDENNPRFTLGYWAIRGLADPIRMMLAFTETPYNNKMYTQLGADADYSRAEWKDVKFSLGLDFPNLPYLIDHKYNDLKLTESQAIMRYVARQTGMAIHTDPQRAYAEMIGDILSDVSRLFTTLCYRTYPDGKAEYLRTALPGKLKPLDTWFCTHPKFKFCTGAEIAYCDFRLCELLEMNLKLESQCLDAFPGLQRFLRDFQALESFQRWTKTGLGELPMNNTVAKFK